MSTRTDPTLLSLKRIEDPSRYRVLHGVPVFAAHRRKDRDGKELTVTEERLGRIVQNARRLEEESGVVPRVTFGHIDPKRDERDLPAPVGFARNWRVGKFGPGKKTAILVDFYLRKDRWEESKTFPYRSAEFYPPSDEITGIAMLRRDPQLDLGILAYGRPVTYDRQNGAYCYALGGDMPDLDDRDLDREPTKRPSDAPRGAADEEDDADAGGGQVAEPDDDRDPDPEFEKFSKHFAKCMKRYGLMAAPSAAAGAMPGRDKGRVKLPDQLDPERKEEPDRLRRTADSEQYRAMRGEIDQVKRRLGKQEEDLRRARDRVDRQAQRYARNESALIVEGLLRDNYRITDPEGLGEKMSRMGEEDRLAYEQEIREHWDRVRGGDEEFLPTGASTSQDRFERYERGGPKAAGSRDDADRREDAFTPRHEQAAYSYMRRQAAEGKSPSWEECEEWALKNAYKPGAAPSANGKK